eukprot:UN17031
MNFPNHHLIKILAGNRNEEKMKCKLMENAITSMKFTPFCARLAFAH